ncbi:MAG: hypothetical protein VYC39_09360 [Myxococcota bacterium]|nr:hypothetical protein [Myxococcota bacterium]
MPPRTREQRLFGAACLKVQLERAGISRSEIYNGALCDLELTDEDVVEFLSRERGRVEAALDHRKDAPTTNEL